MGIWFGYFVLVNFLGYYVMSSDKKRAKARKQRIPEKTLFLIAFVGGSFGVYNAMKVYRHKTLHKSFSIGIPVILLIQVVVITYIIIIH